MLKDTFEQWKEKLHLYGEDYLLEENVMFASMDDFWAAFRYLRAWKADALRAKYARRTGRAKKRASRFSGSGPAFDDADDGSKP
jgi:hypothetical protein